MAKDRTNKSGSADADVEYYIDLFKWAFRMCEKDISRLKTLQQCYDNTLLSTEMPTQSKIPIADFYDMVEKSLPSVLDYLFAPTNPVKLLPVESGVSMDSVRKVERALYIMATHRMKIQRNSIATLKDVFKCGIGFGIVEPIMVTPPASFEITTVESGETARTRAMRPGTQERSIRLRYINPGQVAVVQDGSDFNGNDPVSTAFLFDLYNERQFRQLYEETGDGEKPLMLGNPEKIIEEARTASFDAVTTMAEFWAKLGGKSLTKLRPDDWKIPVHVPILKCFDEDRHVWIANGTTRIYDVEDELTTLRRPLVKASAWLDGNRFYPMSTPEAYHKISTANNIIVNLFLDLMTMMLRRPLVYNAEYFDREPSFGPDERVRTSAADARMGAAFLESPGIDTGALTLFDMINRKGKSLAGQKDYMDKNYTRGGGMAFQDLMSTMEGIERMHAAVIETGFLESVFNQALIFMQSGVGREGLTLRQRSTRRVGKRSEDFIEELKVTENDLLHAYEMSLDLRGKYRRGAMERQLSLSIYDRKIKSPYFDPYEVSADYLCDSEDEKMRQLKSKEEVERIEAENREMEMREREAGVRAATPAGEGGIEGALAGAGATAGGETAIEVPAGEGVGL